MAAVKTPLHTFCLLISVVSSAFALPHGISHTSTAWKPAFTVSESDPTPNGNTIITVCWDFDNHQVKKRNGLAYHWHLQKFKHTIKKSLKETWERTLSVQFDFKEKRTFTPCDVDFGLQQGDMPAPGFSIGAGNRSKAVFINPFWLVPNAIRDHKGRDVFFQQRGYYPNRVRIRRVGWETVEPIFDWFAKPVARRIHEQYEWVRAIAIHEFGHILGMRHPSRVMGSGNPLYTEPVISLYDMRSIMNSHMRPVPKVALSCGDLMLIANLYPLRNKPFICELDCGQITYATNFNGKVSWQVVHPLSRQSHILQPKIIGCGFSDGPPMISDQMSDDICIDYEQIIQPAVQKKSSAVKQTREISMESAAPPGVQPCYNLPCSEVFPMPASNRCVEQSTDQFTGFCPDPISNRRYLSVKQSNAFFNTILKLGKIHPGKRSYDPIQRYGI